MKESESELEVLKIEESEPELLYTNSAALPPITTSVRSRVYFSFLSLIPHNTKHPTYDSYKSNILYKTLNSISWRH
jgi:hypothetical protein